MTESCTWIPQAHTHTNTDTRACTRAHIHTHTHSHTTYPSIRANNKSEGFVEPSIVPTPMKHCMSKAIQGSVVVLKGKRIISKPVFIKNAQYSKYMLVLVNSPFCLRTVTALEVDAPEFKPRRQWVHAKTFATERASSVQRIRNKSYSCHFCTVQLKQNKLSLEWTLLQKKKN